VSLFFTLSGFLITNLLLAESTATGGVSLRTFWARRARRLLPAAFAGIGLAIVAVAIVGTADQLRQLPGDVLGATLYVANWRFVLDHSAYAAGYQAPSPLLHYWSLAIEEQAYLVLPILVLVLTRRRATRPRPSRRRLLAAVLALMAASAVATLILGAASDPNRVYYGTDTRGFELLAGVLLALLVGFPAVRSAASSLRRRVTSGAGVAILGITLALWVTVPETARWLYRGGLWGVSALSCALILAAFGGGWFAKVLGGRVLATLGRMSYGIYVYHWPLIILLQPGTAGLHGLGLAGLRVGATAVVATASYHWLELPIRQQRWRLPRVTWRLAPLIPAVAVLAAFVVSDQAASRSVASLRDTPIVLQEVPPPAVPPVPGLRRVLFMGDSLVQEAYPTFAARLGTEGVSTRVLGAGGQSLMSHGGAWLAQLTQGIATFNPDVVVLESCCGNFKFDPEWVGPDGRPVPPDTPAFWSEWRRLATEASVIAGSRGAVVLWALGPPTHTNGWYGAIDGRIPVVNGIYRSLAACDPRMGTVDWGVISGPGRTYAATLPDAAGHQVTVRNVDGFHFTPPGWSLQADVTLAGITHQWDVDGGRTKAWDGTCP